ncbi:MAG: hypothetical protein ACK4NY_02310 [Spirosomataceae bacterium]
MKKYFKYLIYQLCLFGASYAIAHEDDKLPGGSNNAKPAFSINKSTANKTFESLENSLNNVINTVHQEQYLQLVETKQMPKGNLSQDALNAQRLFNDLEKNQKIISNISPSTLQALPVAMPMLGTSKALIAIKSAKIMPTHAELEVYVRLYIGDQEFYFGNDKVKYAYNSGFADKSSLVLLGKQDYTTKHFALTLSGVPLGSAPTPETTQININCGNFENLVIKGKFNLNSDLYTALDSQGHQSSGAITSNVNMTVTDLSKISIKIVNLTAFSLKKSASKVGFLVSEAEIDMSEKNNVSSDATNFLVTNVLEKSQSSASNQWMGFYAKTLALYLPMHYISTTANDIKNKVKKARTKVDASDLVIDDSGLYFKYNKENPQPDSKLMGIGFKLTKLDVVIKKSVFEKFDTEGLLANPFTLSSLIARASNNTTNPKGKGGPNPYEYSEFLFDSDNTETLPVAESENYQINGPMSGTDEPSFKLNYRGRGLLSLFGGSTAPNPNSEFGMQRPDPIWFGITPMIRLNGKMNIGASKGETGISITSGATGSDFSGLILEYENLLLEWNSGPKFMFDRISLEASGSLLDLPVGINSVIATYDKDKQIIAIELDSYFGLDKLSPKLPRIEGVMTFNVNYGFDKSGNIFGTFESWTFDRLKLDGQVGPLRVAGVLTLDINKKEAEFNSKLLVRGSVEITSDYKFLQKFNGNFIFGLSVNKYTFFYFDALLYIQKGYPIGTTGMQINGFGLGCFYNMKKVPGQTSNYSLSGAKYAPSVNYHGGLIVIGVSDIPTKGRYFQGYAGFDINFGPGWSLANIGIFAGAKFGSSNSVISKDGISRNMVKKKAIEQPRTDANAKLDKYTSIRAEYDNATTDAAKQAVLKKYGLADEKALKAKEEKAKYNIEQVKKKEEEEAFRKEQERFKQEAQAKLNKILEAEQAQINAEKDLKRKREELLAKKEEIEKSKGKETEINNKIKNFNSEISSINKTLEAAKRNQPTKAQRDEVQKKYNTAIVQLAGAKAQSKKLKDLLAIAEKKNPKSESIIAQINALKSQIVSYEKDINSLETQINATLNELNKYAEADKAVNTIEKELFAKQNELNNSQNELNAVKNLEKEYKDLQKAEKEADALASKKAKEFNDINNTDALKEEINLALKEGIEDVQKELIGKTFKGTDGVEYRLDQICSSASSDACQRAVSKMTPAQKQLYGSIIDKQKMLEEQQKMFAQINTNKELQATMDKVNAILANKKKNDPVVFTIKQPEYVTKLLTEVQAKWLNFNYESTKKTLTDMRKKIFDDISNAEKNVTQTESDARKAIEASKKDVPELDPNLSFDQNRKILAEKIINLKSGKDLLGRGIGPKERARIALDAILKVSDAQKALELKNKAKSQALSIFETDEQFKVFISMIVSEKLSTGLQNLSLSEIDERISAHEIAATAAKMRLNGDYEKTKNEIGVKQENFDNTKSKNVTFNGKPVNAADIATELQKKGIILIVFNTEKEYDDEIARLTSTTGKTPEQIEIDKAKILAYEYRKNENELSKSKKIIDTIEDEINYKQSIEILKLTDIASVKEAFQKEKVNYDKLIKLEKDLNKSNAPIFFKNQNDKQLADSRKRLESLQKLMDEYEQATENIKRIKKQNGAALAYAEQQLYDLEIAIQKANEAEKADYTQQKEELERRLARLRDIAYVQPDIDELADVLPEELENIRDAESEDFDDISTDGAFAMIKASASYDLEAKEFHLMALAYINIEQPSSTIRGKRNSAGYAGVVDMCIGCKSGFHLWVGTPGQPIEVQIELKPGMGLMGSIQQDIQFYLIGGSLPSEPRLISRVYPEGIQKVINELKNAGRLSFTPSEVLTTAYSNASNGIGFGFAFDQSKTKDSQIGPLAYNIGYGIGLDLLLAFNDPCSPTGYYGTGTLAAYAKGSISFKVSFWGAKINIKLLSAQVSLVMAGGVPEPLFFKGNADFKFSALGGAVRGRVGVDFSIGKQCSLAGLFEGGRLNVFNEMHIGDKRHVHIRTKYDVFNKFSITVDGVRYDDGGLVVLNQRLYSNGNSLPNYKTYYHMENYKIYSLAEIKDGGVWAANATYNYKLTIYIAQVSFYKKDGKHYCNPTPINPQKYNQPISISWKTNKDGRIESTTWEEDRDPNESKSAIEAPKE